MVDAHRGTGGWRLRAAEVALQWPRREEGVSMQTSLPFEAAFEAAVLSPSADSRSRAWGQRRDRFAGITRWGGPRDRPAGMRARRLRDVGALRDGRRE